MMICQLKICKAQKRLTNEIGEKVYGYLKELYASVPFTIQESYGKQTIFNQNYEQIKRKPISILQKRRSTQLHPDSLNQVA